MMVRGPNCMLTLCFNIYLTSYRIGPRKDAFAAQCFIKNMFLNVNPDREKTIYSHSTVATSKCT